MWCPRRALLTLTRIDGEVPGEWGIYVQGKAGCAQRWKVRKGRSAAPLPPMGWKAAAVRCAASSWKRRCSPRRGALTFSGSVRDSRGRSSAALSETIFVHAWETPRLTEVELSRCTADGAADENGTFLKVRFAQQFSACDGHNSAQVKLKYRALGTEDWSTSAALAAGQDNLLSGFAINSTYELSWKSPMPLPADAMRVCCRRRSALSTSAPTGRGWRWAR